MDLPFTFLPMTALTTLAVALLVTAGTGLLGTWSVLGQKAAPVLQRALVLVAARADIYQIGKIMTLLSWFGSCVKLEPTPYSSVAC